MKRWRQQWRTKIAIATWKRAYKFTGDTKRKTVKVSAKVNAIHKLRSLSTIRRTHNTQFYIHRSCLSPVGNAIHSVIHYAMAHRRPSPADHYLPAHFSTAPHALELILLQKMCTVSFSIILKKLCIFHVACQFSLVFGRLSPLAGCVCVCRCFPFGTETPTPAGDLCEVTGKPMSAMMTVSRCKRKFESRVPSTFFLWKCRQQHAIPIQRTANSIGKI